MGGGGATLIDSAENNIEAEIDEEYIVTYKSYNDYFIDLNIVKETIGEEDLTGNGSESNPYVVHSTRGFLYLSNKAINNIDLNNKYITLACDIILNEEIFDENGQPTGGDGVVYSWEAVSSYGIRLIGASHKIFGLYSKGENRAGLIGGDSATSLIKDLVLENVYINAETYAYGFAFVVRNIEDCSILSGKICSENGNAQAIGYEVCCIKNFDNYSKISSKKGYAVGMAYKLIEQAVGCKNFGECIAYYYSAGLFVKGGGRGQVKIEHCENYARIEGDRYVGGILASVQKNDNFIISHCKNYGVIHCGMSSGGIVGYSFGKLQIKNCTNFGSIEATSASNKYVGMMIGNIYQLTESVGNVEILNCSVEVVDEGKYCAIISGNVTDETYLMVKNFNANININDQNSLCVFYYISNSAILEAENVFIKTNGKEDTNIIVCEAVRSNAKVFVKTFLITAQNKKITFCTDSRGALGLYIKNSLFEGNTKVFYGDDFSDFFVNYKTGQIGIKALSGKGYWQGKITHKFLQENRYIKGEI